jgi:hypothetical protein
VPEWAAVASFTIKHLATAHFLPSTLSATFADVLTWAVSQRDSRHHQSMVDAKNVLLLNLLTHRLLPTTVTTWRRGSSNDFSPPPKDLMILRKYSSLLASSFEHVVAQFVKRTWLATNLVYDPAVSADLYIRLIFHLQMHMDLYAFRLRPVSQHSSLLSQSQSVSSGIDACHLQTHGRTCSEDASFPSPRRWKGGGMRGDFFQENR